MKRVILSIMVICLCVGLCACGKSQEAQKADELILAIGEISLEDETAVLAAKAYYDMLSEKQKAQVENVAILEFSIQELDALKKADEYKKTYDSMVEYMNDLQMDKAYAECIKLPEDYEDVAQRSNVIAQYVGIAGTWVCDNYVSTSNKGDEFGAIFKEITIDLNNWDGGKIGISFSGSLAQGEYSNQSIIVKPGYQDMLFMINNGGLLGDVQQTENGDRTLGYHLAGKTGFGQLKTSFSITTENKMIVEYRRENGSDITSVTFIYSKQQ